MAKQETADRLQIEILRWSSKNFHQLKDELSQPVSYVPESGEQRFTIEVQLLECTDEYVHVSVDVDDGSLVRTFKPLTKSFIVYRDGKVDA